MNNHLTQITLANGLKILLKEIRTAPAHAPMGTSVELYFRSSANADMSGAKDWSPLGRGQATPGAGLRFCQFRAVLTRNDPGLFPVLDWVSLRYTGIQGVKLTTDGSRWTDASGTSSWEAITS